MAIARTETYDFLIDTIPKPELTQYVPVETFVSQIVAKWLFSVLTYFPQTNLDTVPKLINEWE
jgi:hypothetical protein